MNNFTALERVMGDALLRNKIFFDEQVYTKTNNGYYIYDFVVYGEYCKIVVECDGPHHDTPQRILKDSIRDLWSVQFDAQSVLRFSMFDIYYRIDDCIKKIKQEIYELDNALYKDKEKQRNIYLEKQKILSRGKYPFIKENQYANFTIKIKSNSINSPNKTDSDLIISNQGRKIDTPNDLKRNNTYNESNNKITLNKNERQTYNTMRKLPKIQKYMLWHLMKISSKENIAIYNGQTKDLKYLIDKDLVRINTLYKGKGFSLFVLPHSPTLIRKLLRGNITIR